MSDWLSGLFKAGGNGQAPGALYSGSGNAPSTFNAIEAGADPKLQEKGSILGMTPATFASIAGQGGAAIAPKDSWQSKLGSVAANFGSQKLAQLAQAEKEKRTTELLKQLFAKSQSRDINRVIDPADKMGMATGIGDADAQMSEAMYGKNLTRTNQML